MYRTHYCNDINESFVGNHVELAGWIQSKRDHGGVLFVDLRDYTGVSQLVINDPELIEKLDANKIETVISAKGTVSLRDEETVNNNIATGKVELVVSEFKVLGKCTKNLPFEIITSKASNENLRLKNRFLDLRNPKVSSSIYKRSQIIKYMRRLMEDEGFLEIQTPILTASSPEGARDFLVPSRKHAGEFYALPQAPQQFKQLLMVSGFDRYFQIAPCFRDEDARADRSPGEFYQLDFEMAFATQEEVLAVCERVIRSIFTKFIGNHKPISEAPFRHITFKESMLKYGNDKPDLRNPLEIIDLTEFFKGVNFPVFKNKVVRAIVAPCKNERWFFDKSLTFATRELGMQGLAHITLLDAEKCEYKDDPIVKKLTDAQKKEMVELTGVKEGETIFFVSDMAEDVAAKNAGFVRDWLGRECDLIDNNSFEFCFIVDFPMYEFDESTDKIIFTHNPFSMPQGGLEALLTKDPTEVLAYQYDLVCNGIELASGAVRNHDIEIMRKAFEIAGYTEDELASRFSALYEAFQYGAPPHAGMAPGVDRMIMLLEDTETIRDVIVFPLDGNARDQMLGAPSPVSEMQLFEANIAIRGTDGAVISSSGNAVAATSAKTADKVLSEDEKLDALLQVNQINLTADEKSIMKKNLAVLNDAEKTMGDIDTENVEPMIYVAERFNVFREDKCIQNFDRADLLRGAPAANDDSWIVPKVVK
ncbi:MAG: aspartate--tRNA ligase [Clostridia bacterium]|nr:aspartate--tRNA ligase [Clostridia bacterium]